MALENRDFSMKELQTFSIKGRLTCGSRFTPVQGANVQLWDYYRCGFCLYSFTFTPCLCPQLQSCRETSY